jgi:hypothetical protein
MQIQRKKLLPFSKRKIKREAWWLRDETTYVACSNTEKNLFEEKKV